MRHLFFLIAFFALACLSASPVLAQNGTSILVNAQSVDYLGYVYDAINQLVTLHADAFQAMGLHIFRGLVIIMIVWHGTQYALGSVSAWHGGFNFAGMVEFLFLAALGLTMLQFYNTPLPGMSTSFHGLFTDEGSYLASVINIDVMNEFLSKVSTIVANTPWPGFLNLFLVVIYVSVLANMAIAEIALFAIIAFGYIAAGVLILVGPLFVPFFIVPKLSWLFWGWFRSLITYAFYQVIANAFVYVWCTVLNAFIDNTVNGDYSLGHFAVLLVPIVMLNVSFLIGLLKVPSLTADLFSGASSAGAGIASGLTGMVRGAFV